MTDSKTITAKITGRGTASTVPDNAGAVDALLLEGDREIGSVTLLPSYHDGELTTWGDGVDHWADAGVQRWLDAQDDRREAIDSIVSAVAEVSR